MPRRHSWNQVTSSANISTSINSVSSDSDYNGRKSYESKVSTASFSLQLTISQIYNFL